ncbi:TPA: hypothetical protein N0F65_010938 [Lagenidium giganteum]|uniref:Transmembrane protein n=1 Tax=Lagenidium giganteum TaxID=4803 RepID=A0AAV2YVG1_9STRA|nr:TPA: hypothetical protein N0F65_010938 [Lagenidium giganteum]
MSVATASLRALEDRATHEKERSVYNTKLCSISFFLVVTLGLSLPSPWSVLGGYWSSSIIECGAALLGHAVLAVSVLCAVRCMQVQGAELFHQLDTKYTIKTPTVATEAPASAAVDRTAALNEVVNLRSLSNLSPMKKSLATGSLEPLPKREGLHRRSFFDPPEITTVEQGKEYVRKLQEQEKERTEAEQAMQSVSSFGGGYGASDPFGGIYGTSSMAPRVYQATAYDPSLANALRRKGKEEDALTAPSNPQVAWRQLEEWGLEMFMHLYCRNIRRVLACHVKDMVEAFAQNVSELQECGVMADVLLRRRASQALLCPPGQTQTLTNVTLADMLQQLTRSNFFVSKSRGVFLFAEHRSYEKYLNVGDPNSPEYASLERQQYVLDRLILLSKDRNLDRFRWDKGAAWKGKDWSESMPTDAEILMNVFCCVLDNMLPAENERDRPFWKNYFLAKPPRLPFASSVRSRLYLVQTKARPPHFKVLVRGAVRDIVPGEENCFHAMVVFLHAVKKTKAGHLESINLHRVLDRVFDVAK